MLINDGEYRETLGRIVDIVNRSRACAVQKASAEMVHMYWLIGGELNANIEWGNKYIDSLSKDIRSIFPQIKGLSARSLKYMAKFNREIDSQLCSSCCTIPWGHIMLLLDKTEPGARREWYISATIENGWSRAVLDHQIDIKLYERQALAGKVTNFTRTLPAPDSELAQQTLKDPYIFDFITAKQGKKERNIEDQMVSNVTKLLLELGTGFALVGRQYHLVVGQTDFYIDLLFYNIKLHCYFVVELKNDDFKPEYAGKLSFYISAIDGELAGEGDNKTIGLLLCKAKDDVVAEYSLQDLNMPIGVSEYRLGDVLPEEYVKYLPSPEDLRARI